MSIELITVLLIATFVVLLGSGLPLAWSTGATATIFGLMLFGPNVMHVMISRIYDMSLSYALVAIPLYVFMATILQATGVAEDLFHTIYIWSGRLRGGLAITTIVACTILAAMVGIVGAEVVTFGLIALPAMSSRGYDKKIALGSICAGGGLSTLIPPSIVFIVYGMLGGCSIGDLFIAGMFPGLILAGFFITYLLVVTLINPELAPVASKEERDVPLRRKIYMLKGLILPAVLIVIVLGSIYFGLATPSEAAGLGAFGCLLVAAQRRKLSWTLIKKGIFDTTIISCMITWMLFGAQTIIGVYTLAGGDKFVKNMLMALPFGKWGVMIVMQMIWILLGCIIDWIGVLMLTLPLFLPIITELGFDPIWFGVVFCMNMHISYLSPPFAPSCFYLKSITPPEITIEDIYKSSLPYLWLTVVALIIVLIFPEVSLWLPSQMRR